MTSSTKGSSVRFSRWSGARQASVPRLTSGSAKAAIVLSSRNTSRRSRTRDIAPITVSMSEAAEPSREGAAEAARQANAASTAGHRLPILTIPEIVEVEPVVRVRPGRGFERLRVTLDPGGDVGLARLPPEVDPVGEGLEADVVTTPTAVDAEEEDDRDAEHARKHDRPGREGRRPAEEAGLDHLLAARDPVAQDADQLAGRERLLDLQQRAGAA